MAISAFLHALRAFQSGHLAFDDLTAELDRQLTAERTPPAALLEILAQLAAAQPLAHEVHEALVRRLMEWPQDPTIATHGGQGARAEPASVRAVDDVLNGRYRLIALIGEGGMIRVFQAVDLRRAEAGAADPHVAVKILNEPFDGDAGSIAALQREAHDLQCLTHPNIVRIIDCDRDGAWAFVIMEYLKGRSLQQLLRASGSSGLENSAALRVISDIGAALDYAHAQRVTHGDLKPGNVIVTDQGVVKVIDFGTARFITRPIGGAPLGLTPRYASPEMTAGQAPQPTDDVYALACVAYEALSGHHPFGRASDRPAHFRLPRPRGMALHQYMAIVRALAFNRKYRTPSIRRFLDDLSATRRRVAVTRSAWLSGLALAILLAVALWARSEHGLRAATAPGSVFRDCPTCPAMTILPAGRFEQGSSAADGDASDFELPRHPVVIPHAIAMSTTETTLGEYREFVTATHREASGCATYDGHWDFRRDASWQDPGFAQTDRHPAACVSWDDAQAYAGWLSEKTGHAYRLPSSAEWEYAARAGGSAAQPWSGAAAACAAANVADETAAQQFSGWRVFPCIDTYVNTAPVASFAANDFGLYDLFGNVFEWVQDCWHDDYSGAPADGSARTDGDCTEREMRGGSWFSPPQYVTASYRNRFDHAYRSSSVGLRLVRELAP